MENVWGVAEPGLEPLAAVQRRVEVAAEVVDLRLVSEN